MIFDVKPYISDKAIDCGPASLKMLLSWYDIEADINALRKDCKLKTIGCTAADIKRAAKKHGLVTGVYKTDADTLLSDTYPSICWWRKEHFLVFCGVDDRGLVVVCDPYKGRYRMSIEFFRLCYSGIAVSQTEDVNND